MLRKFENVMSETDLALWYYRQNPASNTIVIGNNRMAVRENLFVTIFNSKGAKHQFTIDKLEPMEAIAIDLKGLHGLSSGFFSLSGVEVSLEGCSHKFECAGLYFKSIENDTK